MPNLIWVMPGQRTGATNVGSCHRGHTAHRAIHRQTVGGGRTPGLGIQLGTPAQLPFGVQRFVVDRKGAGQLATALRNHRPDAVIDMIGYVVQHAKEVYSALHCRYFIMCCVVPLPSTIALVGAPLTNLPPSPLMTHTPSAKSLVSSF